jgi:hypothetical protein
MIKISNFIQAIKRFMPQLPFPFRLSMVILGVVLAGISTLNAQNKATQITPPSWWIGLGAGGNLNYFQGSTQQLHTGLMAPVPFKKGLYLYAGPRISYLLDKSFVYSQRNDPANADQTPIDDIRGDFDAVNKVVYSMQIGAGYDILLSNNTHRAQFVLSPFVAFLPYFGQNRRR